MNIESYRWTGYIWLILLSSLWLPAQWLPTQQSPTQWAPMPALLTHFSNIQMYKGKNSVSWFFIYILYIKIWFRASLIQQQYHQHMLMKYHGVTRMHIERCIFPASHSVPALLTKGMLLVSCLCSLFYCTWCYFLKNKYIKLMWFVSTNHIKKKPYISLEERNWTIKEEEKRNSEG